MNTKKYSPYLSIDIKLLKKQHKYIIKMFKAKNNASELEGLDNFLFELIEALDANGYAELSISRQPDNSNDKA